MKKPHLKLGDTSRYVKHLIRALRKSCMAYYFYKPDAIGLWYDKDVLEKTKYHHFTNSIKCIVWGFQLREGLPRTGECDAATWAKLARFL